MLNAFFLTLSASTLMPVHSTFPPSPQAIEGRWIVEDLGGGGIIDSSHLELVFSHDGTFVGFSGCNTMTGAFALQGIRMSLQDIARTERRCAPALMIQETRLLEALDAVVGFDIDHTGALILRCPDGSCLTARKAEH